MKTYYDWHDYLEWAGIAAVIIMGVVLFVGLLLL